jgi:hypothetical protein
VRRDGIQIHHKDETRRIQHCLREEIEATKEMGDETVTEVARKVSRGKKNRTTGRSSI